MTDQQAFLWRQRLTEERDLKNLTDLHTRILLFTQGAILDGEDQMSHAAVAEALKVGVRTVGDAYRRARALGLLMWEAQFRAVQGVRRRTVNRYWLVMPEVAAEARPDVRRGPVHTGSSVIPSTHTPSSPCSRAYSRAPSSIR